MLLLELRLSWLLKIMQCFLVTKSVPNCMNSFKINDLFIFTMHMLKIRKLPFTSNTADCVKRELIATALKPNAESDKH